MQNYTSIEEKEGSIFDGNHANSYDSTSYEVNSPWTISEDDRCMVD